ncbi:hypothetical protein Tco_0708262, partial [Tanacetum coccineum]
GEFKFGWEGGASSSISTTPITKRVDKFERQLIEGKLLLVNDDGKSLPKVASTVNADSDSKVEKVFDEHTTFMASTSLKHDSDSGYDTNRLWKQWKETKRDDNYNPYDDDLLYKDDWIYEWNKDVPWVHERPWTENGVWKEPTLNLPGAYIIGNTLRYQDLEWYEALKDGKLKEYALKNKAIMDGMINEDDESSNEGWKRWDNFDNTNRDNEESDNEMKHEDEERSEVFDDHERPVCYIRRFEMVKYSFKNDEEYVAIKENECNDLTNTSEEAIYAYQEIFRMMEEGWMVTRTK